MSTLSINAIAAGNRNARWFTFTLMLVCKIPSFSSPKLPLILLTQCPQLKIRMEVPSIPSTLLLGIRGFESSISQPNWGKQKEGKTSTQSPMYFHERNELYSRFNNCECFEPNIHPFLSYSQRLLLKQIINRNQV